MECIRVCGGRRLQGRVEAEGAKNAALPILAGSLLAETGETVLRNVPMVTDVLLMTDMLRQLSVHVCVDREQNLVRVDSAGQVNDGVSELARSMRASILLMGALLSRAGRVRVPAPGGCRIGARPVELHLLGFQALGASVKFHDQDNERYIEAHSKYGLHGAHIDLKFPSVGATQNIMMAAVKAKGTTVIQNAAREPEIEDLADFLCKLGARIDGAGTGTITIEGVKRLHGTEHVVMQDRIEAGTFMIAAAMTQGNVLVAGAREDHHEALITVLRDVGAVVKEEATGVRVRGPGDLQPTVVSTAPYPGFPTDLQAPLAALLLHASGVSILTEMLFENRFHHLEEMRRMNAEVKIDGRIAYLCGGSLRGCVVRAGDLRGGAALLLAGLRASGTTTLTHLHHLDRGYHMIHTKLQQLGAEIERTTLKLHENIIMHC